MKVLVTGGGGFVGRHLIARLLARGYKVRSFGRSAQPVRSSGVECHRGDLADAALSPPPAPGWTRLSRSREGGHLGKLE